MFNIKILIIIIAIITLLFFLYFNRYHESFITLPRTISVNTVSNKCESLDNIKPIIIESVNKYENQISNKIVEMILQLYTENLEKSIDIRLKDFLKAFKDKIFDNELFINMLPKIQSKSDDKKNYTKLKLINYSDNETDSQIKKLIDDENEYLVNKIIEKLYFELRTFDTGYDKETQQKIRQKLIKIALIYMIICEYGSICDNIKLDLLFDYAKNNGFKKNNISEYSKLYNTNTDIFTK